MTSRYSPLFEGQAPQPSNGIFEYYAQTAKSTTLYARGPSYAPCASDIELERLGPCEDTKAGASNSNVDRIRPDKGAPRTLHADGWLYEILSLGLALISLVVLVAILVVYDTQPMPAWVGGLTLNTVISIVSLTFRFGLMVPVGACISQLAWIGLAQGERPLHDVVRYDWASRSPWGSAALLFRAPNHR